MGVPPVSQASGKPAGSKTAAIFDLIVSVSLVALFFGVPLFFTGLTFQGIAFEKQLYFYFWLLIGLIAWVSKGVITGEMRIRRTPLDIPILLFWAFYIVAAFFSLDRWHSFWGFFGDPSRGVVSVTALVLAYYLILSHFNEKRFKAIFAAFLASGWIVVLWSSLVVLKIRFLPAALEKFVPLSPIGTVSTLTTFLSVLLPLFMTGIFVLWRSDSQAKRSATRMLLTVLLGLGILFDLFLLLALYSFVTWAVALIGLSFFVVYILAQIVRPSEQLTWMPMLIFVVMLVFLMIGSNTLARATLPIEVSPNTTLSWSIAKETLKEHFFSGVGPANYGYAFSQYRPVEYNLNTLYTLRFYQGNGLFFEALASIGAVGTVLLLVLWLSFVSVGVYLLSLEKQRNKIYSLGLWAAVIMFLVAGFVASFNGPLIIISALLGALALAVILWESGSEERYLQLSLKAAPKFALALAFIFMVVSAGVAFLFVFMGKVLVADMNAGKAVRMSAVQPSDDTALLLIRSIQSYPQEGRYYTRLGQEYMTLANTEAGKGEGNRDNNRVADYVREAVRATEQGKNLMPNDVLAAESLALIYENAALYASDALPKAEEFYKRAQELEPQNPLYAVKIGQVKRTQGDAKPEGAERTALYNESKTYFDDAIAKKKDLAVAHYQLALTQSRLKDLDQAIESTMRAMQIDKKNVNYQYNLGVLYQLRDSDGDRDRAETIFKEILSANERLIDVRLSLGLLYEKRGNRDAALAEYRKMLEFLPADAGGNVAETRTQIEKLIQNVQNGTGNLTRPNQGQQAQTPVTPEPPVEGSEVPVAPVAPVQPNQSPLSPDQP
ncbi:MAG: hypothetical protein A2808_04120 [Candidatus Moranbacteria bacterium RIFCSPHIGHO2_01_FULL_55_24]|nr:MAG: hypothetical protein A2808_04120 [Candidatus Moranbacteria bacterium RIFCSPHIGHO2_01_FULL_55_24]